MDLGLSTSMLGVGALPHRLAIFSAYEIPWIEIHGYAREEFDYANGDLVRDTARTLSRLGLKLWSCHSPAGKALDVAAADDGERTESVRIVRQALTAAADLGARVFVCDAVRKVTREPEERAHRHTLLAESLHMLQEDAGRLGLRVVIENHQGWSLFETPQDFLELRARFDLPDVGACWDTGHGWQAGQPPESACALGTHLVTLHLHDNDGQKDLHLPPTDGTMTWSPLVPGLRRIGYQGPFMMELAPPSEGTSDEAIGQLAARAIEVYRTLVDGD